jgi:uncharacterized protein
MTSPYGTQDVTSDDKLWALLTYILTPIVPLIIMFALPDKKARPFLAYHNPQALALGVISFATGLLGSFLWPLLCLPPIIFIASIYFGIKAYQGEMFSIPVVTDFMKKQGWM